MGESKHKATISQEMFRFIFPFFLGTFSLLMETLSYAALMDHLLFLPQDVAEMVTDYLCDDVCRVEVKAWRAVVSWNYTNAADSCGLCNSSTEFPCESCQSLSPFTIPLMRTEQEPLLFCPISWVSCGHSFHSHCLANWQKTRQTCPHDDISLDDTDMSE